MTFGGKCGNDPNLRNPFNLHVKFILIAFCYWNHTICSLNKNFQFGNCSPSFLLKICTFSDFKKRYKLDPHG